MDKKTRISRTIIGIILVISISFAYGLRFVKIQLIDGEMYKAMGQASFARTVPMEAPRGEIMDINGNPLVVNRVGYSIIFDRAFFPMGKDKVDQKNRIIIEMTRLMERQKETWIDNFPLYITIDGYVDFEPDSDAQIKNLKEKFRLNSYATAQNCFDAALEIYSIKDYLPEDARTIAAICYSMEVADFSVQNPYVFAHDVKNDTIAKVRENSTLFVGVDILSEPYREYVDETIAPHVLGMTGAIDPKEYKEYKAKGYRMNDTIGKSGLEKAMESLLKGTRGRKQITTDYNGVPSVEVLQAPQQGNSVVSTLDISLQRVAQGSLEKVILDCREKNEIETRAGVELDHGKAPGGAVVVMDVKTGGVKALCSYPTYTMGQYTGNFASLSKDTTRPLYNRATMGAYPPGSTYKPGVALAGLEEGKITKDTHIKCVQIYTELGETYTPRCLGLHGNIDLKQALNVSCNYYFFEVGRRTGIEKMNLWQKKLGFGQPTGLEIPEGSGNLAGLESRSAKGQKWMPGDTVQSAIGQSDNLVTPVQLANYIATIVNGGTRYQAHLVDSVKSYDFSRTVMEKVPEVANVTGFKLENIESVKEGMYMLANAGSCRSYFADLPEKVGCKTGTAQVTGKMGYGMFIAYAPADNPEIAVAIAIEELGHGRYAAPIAADIFREYFNKISGEKSQQENVLLN